MGRISRKCYDSNCFHVMVKGIGSEYIFKYRRDKEKYINSLIENASLLNVKILAYCIMDNHAHILLYVNSISDLSKIMASTNTKYAIYYNKTNGRNGYVFRDRYRCENMHTQEYLENCIRYIHSNPVVAGMCASESEYEFSTYKQYLNKTGIINDEVINLSFRSGENYIKKLNAKICYENFIEVNNEFGEQQSEKVDKVIEELLRDKNMNNEKFTNEEIITIGKELLKRCRITKKEVAEKLKVERTKFIRLMRKCDE